MIFSKTTIVMQYLVLILFATQSESVSTMKSRAFPHLIDFESSEVGKPAFEFDGVDFDALPEPFKSEYTDCYSDNMRCIRHKTYHNPVCAYDMRDWRMKQYINQCEVNFQNCKAIVKKEGAKYGKEQRSGLVLFVGEGLKCQYSLRSGNRENDQELNKKVVADEIPTA